MCCQRVCKSHTHPDASCVHKGKCSPKAGGWGSGSRKLLPKSGPEAGAVDAHPPHLQKEVADAPRSSGHWPLSPSWHRLQKDEQTGPRLLDHWAGDQHLCPSSVCSPASRQSSLTFCDPDVELLREPRLKELFIFLKDPGSLSPAPLLRFRPAARGPHPLWVSRFRAPSAGG